MLLQQYYGESYNTVYISEDNRFQINDLSFHFKKLEKIKPN